ncbi:MAG: hypothetical protein LBG52_07700 [Candidatus Peribacteria bacterium]|jgi:hypothetical protein|nr:hypothetical protein [Candidatus Peribacteria bacterium]
MQDLTVEQLTSAIKTYRAAEYLKTTEKANSNDPTALKLRQFTNNQKLTAFQENLYFNKDIVEALGAFMATKENQALFGNNEDGMMKFFMSEWYQEVLLHMVNKQIDDPQKKEITTHYIKKNMDYRIRVRDQYDKVGDDIALKEKFDIATTVFRAKTNILRNRSGKELAVLSQEMNDFLATPTGRGNQTYLDIMTDPEVIQFFGDTVISAIRLEEHKESGKIDFTDDTKVYDLTDIQFYYYLHQYNRTTPSPFVFTDIYGKHTQQITASLQ